jgi:hypothetical protein
MSLTMRSMRWNFAAVKFSIIGLFILFQVFLIFIKKHEALDIDSYPNTRPTANIYGYHKIGQTFVAERDNLCRIDLKLGTHGRENNKTVLFQLWQQTPKRTLVDQKEFNASAVKNNLYHPIRFPPVGGSREREFYFFLYSPESTPDDSICAWMNGKNIYDGGHMILNGRPRLGDLVFRVYSRRPVYTEIGRIVRNYSGVFGNKYILILVILLFVCVQVLVLNKLLESMHKILIHS